MALVSLGSIFLASCGDEGNEVDDPKPVVNFLGGSEYIDEDAELAAGTAFQMAITANHDKNIRSVKVTRSVDGNPAIELVDSAFNDKSIAEFVYSGSTLAEAGEETYSFIVADKDGNSTTKSVIITNLGEPGRDLVVIEQDNDGNTIKVYNVEGPNLGAFGITVGTALSTGDDDIEKDIVDATLRSELPNWPAKWKSLNGTMFKKVTTSNWASVTNDAELVAVWEASGNAVSELSIVDGDLIVMDLGGSGDNGYALVEITEVVTTPSNNEDYVQFRYKRQDLL